MRKWSVRLFGALELESPSGHVTSFPGTKAGGILAYLALTPGKPVPRVELADFFWPDNDPARQRTRVRQELLVLRSVFGEEEATVLLNDRHSLSLSSDLVTTDVEQFVRLLEKARLSTDPLYQARALAEAVTLYRADLLTAYPDIAVGERALLTQRFESALRDLAALRHSQGDFVGAEACLRRLIAYNPLLEEAHTDLMKVYAASGQPAKIRNQFSILQRTLQSEIDVAPTESTRALVEELLRSIEVPANLPSPSPPPPDDEIRDFAPEQTDHNAPPAATEMPQISPAPPRTTALPHYRWWMLGALSLLLLVGALLLRPGWGNHTRGARSLPSPRLQINSEKWKYLYPLQPGEKGDAEPKALVCDNRGIIYVTGLVQTQSADTDILTLKLSPEGKLLARTRYSSPERDCDRAFAIAYNRSNGIFVAGESFVPASKGVKEGWRLVLLRYDTDLRLLWVRRSPVLTKNEPNGVRVVLSDQGGVVVGGTATENGVQKMLLLQYDTNGALHWQRTFNAESGKSTLFSDMTVDADGYLYVCCVALRDVDKYGSHTEWATLCYDRNGTRLWTRYCSGSGHGNDAAHCISFAEQDKAVYVAGTFYNGDPATGGTGTNAAVAKYKIDGTPLWTRWDTLTGPELNGVTALARNSVPDVVTILSTKNTPERNSALLLSQYDAAGNQRWSRKYMPPPGFRSSARPYAITTDKDEIVLAGLITHLPTSRLYENSKLLLARYSIEGVLKEQNAFGLLAGVNRPTASGYSYWDNTVLIGGQTQIEEQRLAWTILKY